MTILNEKQTSILRGHSYYFYELSEVNELASFELLETHNIFKVYSEFVLLKNVHIVCCSDLNKIAMVIILQFFSILVSCNFMPNNDFHFHFIAMRQFTSLVIYSWHLRFIQLVIKFFTL